DIGYMTHYKQRMQNAVDAAALAAAQEITAAVKNAPPGTTDVTQFIRESARAVAANVADLNGIYVDPAVDVEFGSRTFNPITEEFEIEWGISPSNCVKVTARKTNLDLNAPDGRLRLFFAGVTGNGTTAMQADAIAYVEARDLVVVHDFSRSMNFDSYFNEEAASRLNDAQIMTNLATVWNDLQPVNAGSLTTTPQYLSLTEQDSGVTATVTFKYDDLTVTTDGDLDQIRVKYDNNNYETFNVSGTSAEIDGYRDIVSAWVTVTPPDSSGSGGDDGPYTVDLGNKSITFSGDRKSASISSNQKLRERYVVFTDGSYDYDSWSNGPYNTSYSSSKEIDYIYLEVSDGQSYWYLFDPPAGGSGSSGGDPIEIRFDDTNTNVKQAFGLTGSYPYRQGSWDSYINHCRDYSQFGSRGLREMYGGLTFANYVLRNESGNWETEALWKTRHYPFHAIKEGHLLLCDFLRDLGFDDHVGMVSYDTYHRVEQILNESDVNIPYVNISSEPITNDYEAVKNLMRYKQAAHYAYATNMGGGLKDAISLLDDHSRTGARPTILLMTDGNTNTIDSGESTSLPSGWDWDEYFDYDGDGVRDYSTNSSQRRYVLRLAKEAVDAGYTIHTMSVGADADRDLMEAIAFLGNGHYIDVPGGYSVTDMEDEVLEAFRRIATFVPPARLLPSED
ncbi:MAG: hypothetical protein KDA80_11280, partial [Planctomycetaceae bacterium]|nr:hypothetical protein [Planctomycetaceae bacterium]